MTTSTPMSYWYLILLTLILIRVSLLHFISTLASKELYGWSSNFIRIFIMDVWRTLFHTGVLPIFLWASCSFENFMCQYIYDKLPFISTCLFACKPISGSFLFVFSCNIPFACPPQRFFSHILCEGFDLGMGGKLFPDFTSCSWKNGWPVICFVWYMHPLSDDLVMEWEINPATSCTYMDQISLWWGVWWKCRWHKWSQKYPTKNSWKKIIMLKNLSLPLNHIYICRFEI